MFIDVLQRVYIAVKSPLALKAAWARRLWTLSSL